MRSDKEITNSEDIIDSLDIIGRIGALESEMEDAKGDWDGSSELTMPEALRDFKNAGLMDELESLRKLRDEADGSPGWEHGETLIRDSYFNEYAEQLAEDIGAISKNMTWPACHIDWDAASDTLKQEYMSVDFAGVEYWIPRKLTVRGAEMILRRRFGVKRG